MGVAAEMLRIDPSTIWVTCMARRAYVDRKSFPIARVLLALGVLFAVGYAVSRGGEDAALPPKQTAPRVSVTTVRTQDIPLQFDYAARLAGSREVEVRARVSGILLQRAYTEGQYVKRGDVLFRIDPEPFKAALAEAKALLQQTERDYRRAVTLQRQRALSPREFDAARSLYDAAKARVRAATINLNFTTVRAPISGYTSDENISEGTLVAADTTVLTRVTQLDPIYVEFAYPDTEAMFQRQGVADGTLRLPEDKLLRVEVVLSDGSIYPQEATIRFTDHIIDTTTGTVRARAVVKNTAQAIMPGQFVRARVKGLTMVQAIGIPDKATMQGPKGTYVYVVDAEGIARVRPVELGLLNSGVRIITRGLEDGDRVVVEGMIKVRPDTAVTADEDADEAITPATEKAPIAAKER